MGFKLCTQMSYELPFSNWRPSIPSFTYPWKQPLLVTITFGRRVGELGALMADTPIPFTVFFKDKVSLCPATKFLPEVLSEFHFNQVIHLSIFFPKPHQTWESAAFHTLDVTRTLAFKLDGIRSFRKFARLLMLITNRSKGSTVSTQGHSRWISECTISCYESPVYIFLLGYWPTPQGLFLPL